MRIQRPVTNVTIRLGRYQPPDSIHNKAATAFGDALFDRFGTDVRFDLDGNITARDRNASDLLHLVENGDFTLCKFSASYLAARVPEFALLDHEGQIEQSRDEDAAKFARKT